MCIHGAAETYERALVEQWSNCDSMKAHDMLIASRMKVTNKSDKRVRLPKVALLDQRVRQCVFETVDATAEGDNGGRVEGAEVLKDSLERKLLSQPPGAQDAVRSTSETSENASSWRIFSRPCSSKRFPSSSDGMKVLLVVPVGCGIPEAAAHIELLVPPLKVVPLKTMPELFCNETEAATFAETEGWEEKEVASIAKNLAALPKNDSKPRTIVVTQGADPTIVCVGGEVTEYPIIALPKEKLVVTNGARDTYVGGFLSGLVQEKSVAHCCAAGTYATSVIVQRSGGTFPPKPDFTFSA